MISSKLIPNVNFHNKLGTKFLTDINEVASMKQTHSNVVLEINKSGIYEADALVTSKKNLMLVVSTADCMPVVLSDNIKVGIIHIGWKGIENKIFFNTIKKFNNKKLKISIGPHAKSCCYEIQNDLKIKFPDFTIERDNKKFLDLSGDIKRFCKDNNIELEIANECTIGDTSFNSYRRDKTLLRQKSTVWI